MAIPNKKTKIAIFHCGFIYSGGGERIVLEEAIGLTKRGFEVEVYAPTLEPQKCYPDLVKKVGVKTFFPTIIGGLPLRNALRMLVSSIMAPFLASRFKDVDMFIGANQPGAWIAFCIAKVLKKPYIIYLNQPNRIVYPRAVDVEYGWTTTVRDYQILYKAFGLVRPIFAWLDKISIMSAGEILVNGEYIGSVIEQIYSHHVTNTPAGAYPAPEKSINFKANFPYEGNIKIKNLSLKKPYLLITNRHDPQKRFDYVIDALKLVLTEFPKLKLVIPGPFTEHTIKLKEIAKEMGVFGNIVFLGQVKEGDLQRLYKHAAVYCYPSPEEDFGLGPLEAGSWGVPTVAWNHAGPTVTVSDGVSGFLAKPYEVDNYAEKIKMLLQSPKLRNKLGRGAYKRVKKMFSWQKHVDLLEEKILNSLKN